MIWPVIGNVIWDLDAEPCVSKQPHCKIEQTLRIDRQSIKGPGICSKNFQALLRRLTRVVVQKWMVNPHSLACLP